MWTYKLTYMRVYTWTLMAGVIGMMYSILSNANANATALSNLTLSYLATLRILLWHTRRIEFSDFRYFSHFLATEHSYEILNTQLYITSHHITSYLIPFHHTATCTLSWRWCSLSTHLLLCAMLTVTLHCTYSAKGTYELTKYILSLFLRTFSILFSNSGIVDDKNITFCGRKNYTFYLLIISLPNV